MQNYLNTFLFLVKMAIFQGKPKRKVSGGRYKNILKKLKLIGNLPTHTKVGDKKTRMKRKRGGKGKLTLASINKINVIDLKTKKAKVVSMKTVLENPANRHLVRRNVITKGSIMETELGKVKVTSRPGQNGSVDGILLEK